MLEKEGETGRGDRYDLNLIFFFILILPNYEFNYFSSIMMRDLDGSLTGEAGTTVVKPDMYFTENSECEAKEGWNLEVCKGRFAKVYTGTVYGFLSNIHLCRFCVYVYMQIIVHLQYQYNNFSST